MESLFHKETPEPPEPTPYDKIGPEIAHLKKGASTRYGPGSSRPAIPWLITLTVLVVIWIYIMDPFFHSYYKYEAIRTYLYLHNYGAGPQSDVLATCGIFTPDEIRILSQRQGDFKSYAVSVDAASKEADSIIHYVQSVKLMHDGKVQSLDLLSKLRYIVFIRPGVPVPTMWTPLDPSVLD